MWLRVSRTMGLCLSMLLLAGFVPQHNFQVPILMYHYIRPLPSPKDTAGIALSVTPETFGLQLNFLKRNGYHTMTFAQLLSGAVVPSKPVILTFDDGYEDAYTQAFPQLIAHGMVGTFYIVTGFVGTSHYVTWPQLQQMAGSGMEIGAHTVNHLDLRKLKTKKKHSQIEDSITTLAHTLHIHVITFAYPAGKYDAQTQMITKGAGIRFAVTTHRGVASDKMNQMALPRIRINDRTKFEKIL